MNSHRGKLLSHSWKLYLWLDQNLERDRRTMSRWLSLVAAQLLLMHISNQSLLQKRKCVFQVTNPKNYRYTKAGNVSGAVQICETTSCCAAIYRMEDGQPKVDALSCDLVNISCPEATCRAKAYLENRFITCTCSTDLCNGNITWTSETPEHAHADPTVGNMKSDVVLVYVCFAVFSTICFISIIITLKWSRKDRKETPQSSVQDDIVNPGCSCQARPSQNQVTDIELQELVSKGHFATVFRAKYKCAVVAIKVYPAEWKHMFLKEKEIYELPLMKNDAIVSFLGTGKKPDNGSLFIVLQFAEYGSLHSFLSKHSTTWTQALRQCQSLSEGLSYLHSDLFNNDVHKPPVAHRDLSSSNVLVRADATCVLSDFGSSTIVRSCSGLHFWQHHISSIKARAQLGTLRYMPPEVLTGSVNLNSSSFLMQGDVYSLALILWEILMCCSDLFEGGIAPQHMLPYDVELDTNITLERLILYVSEMNKRPTIPDCWETRPQGPFLKELLTECWDCDTDARLTAPCVLDRLTSLSTSSFE